MRIHTRVASPLLASVVFLLLACGDDAGEPDAFDAGTDAGGGDNDGGVDGGVEDGGADRDSDVEGGCGSDEDCEADFFCEQMAESCSGRGECVPVSNSCSPVDPAECGCDGTLYQNSCARRASRVSRAPESTCM